MLLQLFVLFFFLIVKVLYNGAHKKIQPGVFNNLSIAAKQKVTKSHGFWRGINDLFDQRLLYSVWMFFIVEATVFTITTLKEKAGI